MSEENTSNEIVESKRPALSFGNRGVMPQSIEEVYRLAKYIHASEFAPKGSTPEMITVRILKGLELGMPIMSAVQNIAVINGRPCLWGDVMLGLVRNSGLISKFSEREEGERKSDKWGFRCTSTRVDGTEAECLFTVQDAKDASLWGKAGPWQNYPKRMLQMRARAFVLRDLYPDVLMGSYSVEEIAGGRDKGFIDIETVQDKPAAAPASIESMTGGIGVAPQKPAEAAAPEKATQDTHKAEKPADGPTGTQDGLFPEVDKGKADLMKLARISHVSEAQIVAFAIENKDAPSGAECLDDLNPGVATRYAASWSSIMGKIGRMGK